MGELVMIIGESGSGKSTSMRNCDKNEISVFNVAGKRLPFKKSLASVDRPSYQFIKDTLKANNKNAYVIDDSTYLMQFDMFRHAKERGYEKFTQMALDFEQLLQAAMATNSDTIVYFLHHPQFGEDGKAKPQTVGKMLDNQLNIEGLFPIVIECAVKDGKHVFITQNDGTNIAKTPMEMFDSSIIDNDLKLVDTTIREYWEMAPLSSTSSKDGGAK